MKQFVVFTSMIAVLILLFVSGFAQTKFSDSEVTIQNGLSTLAGTLSLPSGDAPFPAVILLSGSGPQDRGETIPSIAGYKPLRWIAESLASQGIAVLRYDDRGVGQSTGKFDTATSAYFAMDAEAAFKFLLERPEIAAKRVGFLGHSEGGMLAAMVAARDSRVAFVISMAGPGVRGDALLLKQNERTLQAMGITGSEFDGAMQSQKQLLDLILAKDWAGLEALFYPEALQELKALPENQKKTGAELEAEARTLTKQTVEATRGWLEFYVSYPIARNWANVKVPVLALFGSLDVQVDAVQNRTGLEAALRQAGNRDVTVRLFPTANHLFLVAKTGSPTEYETLPMKFVPRFLETINNWLQLRFGNVK